MSSRMAGNLIAGSDIHGNTPGPCTSVLATPERYRHMIGYRPPATDVRVDSLPAGVADGLLAIARAIDRLTDAIGAAKETESDHD